MAKQPVKSAVPRQSPATKYGRIAAMAALAHRRANMPKKVDNASLHAGSPMYFYCIACGAEADVKPESYTTPPKKLCRECQAMQDLGWLE